MWTALLLAAAVAAASGGTLTSILDDPLASADPYDQLTESELHHHWSGDGAAADGRVPTLAERLHALAELEEVTYVDVRLVGFEGDGNHGVHVAERELQRLLDAGSNVERQHVLSPPLGGSHTLPVTRRFVYGVRRVEPALATAVAAAVAGHVEAGGSVPVTATDDLIADDYRRQRGTHVALYLLNPTPPRRLAASGRFGTAADRRVADEVNASAPSPPAREVPPAAWVPVRYHYEGRGACGGVKWVGAGRYAWVDLSAGPVAYGPVTAGDGGVGEHRMPVVPNTAHASETAAEGARQRLTVELAALALRSARDLTRTRTRVLSTHR